MCCPSGAQAAPCSLECHWGRGWTPGEDGAPALLLPGSDLTGPPRHSICSLGIVSAPTASVGEERG